MKLTSSHPFWSINNGLPATYPALRRDVSCDAGVIGGGITGALVGVRLAETGVKTLVLDKRDIGTGSTSASTALLQYEIDVPLRELTKKIGPGAATRGYQLCRGAIPWAEKIAMPICFVSAVDPAQPGLPNHGRAKANAMGIKSESHEFRSSSCLQGVSAR